ncbi:DUF2559 family protein [Halomonas sp. PAMB 3264]|uniref:YhfG family protein n=1 Tax=Halomonas sp. PAMB 3264 TaxID=3075222 RepID=UPI00289F7EE2|nr:YhfG family protein [Halomonas sp. PAMB 3264]WNL43242.1 DUF2559 family protein [Halomonas sp. PAMB 3264]
MQTLSWETKRRYNAEVRRTNYQSSMALEGIAVDPRTSRLTKADVIAKYTKTQKR